MKEVQLTRGKVALIDDEDFVRISRYKWQVIKPKKNVEKYYATTDIRYKRYYMHRVIMKVKDPKIEVDHINGNSLDNRKENLRFVNNHQNSRNSKIPATNTSGYKGVYLDKRIMNKRWVAYIHVNDKKIHLGYFSDIIDAAKCYNEAAIKYFGEYARLNIL